jgi:hypothetical protein
VNRLSLKKLFLVAIDSRFIQLNHRQFLSKNVRSGHLSPGEAGRATTTAQPKISIRASQFRTVTAIAFSEQFTKLFI